MKILRASVESMTTYIEGVLPLLQNGARPHLVDVGSSAAYPNLPREEAYSGSKAAIACMIDTLRITLSPFKIDVRSVCPGFVKTPLTDLNDFPMPYLISVEQTSKYIRKGIARRQKKIHLPRRFSTIMKFLSLLPCSLWFMRAKRMLKK